MEFAFGLLALLAAQAPADLEIVHINVGQGDATLIRGPEDANGGRVTVLVDAGDITFQGDPDGGAIVLGALLERGISELDFFIVTHYDADHIGGAIAGSPGIHGSSFILGRNGTPGDIGDDDGDGHDGWIGRRSTSRLPRAQGRPAWGLGYLPFRTSPAIADALAGSPVNASLSKGSRPPALHQAQMRTGAMKSPNRIPFFGARKLAHRLADEVRRLEAELSRLGALPLAEIERRRQALAIEVQEQEQILLARKAMAESEISNRRAMADSEHKALMEKLQTLRRAVVATEETVLLQEAGIYQCRHPLGDSVAYSKELDRITDQLKTMAKKDGGAILASTAWTVNNSEAQGRKMVREYSKLMLRAYNAEADNLVRCMKPYKLDRSLERLEKVAATIERLGKTMDIRIAPDFHRLRVLELELTADYLDKLADEKERERERRARAREDKAAQRELEHERKRLDKERAHCMNALTALIEAGDEAGAARVREQLSDVNRAIKDVDYRTANVRAGYVYVISNIGAFGERLIKIGMTRRLNPQERVDELGDASVPFRFDVHALFFSVDAVGIESKLHERLADRRVNLVNRRREFFYATPGEVKEHLLVLTGELLQYREFAEAAEYRQSTAARESQSAAA